MGGSVGQSVRVGVTTRGRLSFQEGSMKLEPVVYGSHLIGTYGDPYLHWLHRWMGLGLVLMCVVSLMPKYIRLLGRVCAFSRRGCVTLY